MRIYLGNPKKRQKLKLLIYDGIVVLAVFLISYLIRIKIYDDGDFYQIWGRVSWLVVFGVLFHITSFYVFGLYDMEKLTKRKLIFVNFFLSVIVASSGLALLSFALPKYQIGRILIGMNVPLMVFAIYYWRIQYGKKERNINDKDIVIVGWDGITEKIIDNTLMHNSGYKLRSHVRLDKREKIESIDNIVAISSTLKSTFEKTNLNAIIFSKIPKNMGALHDFFVDLKFEGIEIYDSLTFYERITGRAPVKEISEGWLLLNGSRSAFKPLIYQNFKRIFDVVVSFFILLLSSPFWVLISILIKLDSKGPIFFRQERLGKYEYPFILLKFRTMIDNAEKECGPRWASENDHRLTRIGKFLRKTRLDEFPQFINVLKGDMSLIGPRPIREHFAQIFTKKFPFYRLRFKIKPGISGWAQVNMSYVNTEEDQYKKLEYEMYYIYNQSIFLDLFIILKTVQSILKMNGE